MRNDVCRDLGHLCPVCGSDKAAVVYRTPDRMFRLPGLFSDARCRSCRSLFIVDPPGDLGVYYPAQEYYSYGGEPRPVRQGSSLLRYAIRAVSLVPIMRLVIQAWRQSSWPRYQDVDALFMRSLKAEPRRICDLGCGDGQALDRYAACGWETWGVEPGAVGASRAAVKGHRMLNEEFGQSPLPRDYFHVIRASHSLEHMANPQDAIEEIVRALRPGGYCVIEIPNITSWLAVIAADAYWGLDAPRHLVLPTPTALAELLKRARLSTVAVWTDSTGLGVARTLLFHLHPAWRLSDGDPLSARLIAALVTPLMLLTDLLGVGDFFRIIAYKDPTRESWA